VIVAVASLAAYGGAAALGAALGFGALGSALFGSVVAYGVGSVGRRVFGLGGSAAIATPFARPDTWLTNEPNSQSPIPVVYGERRIGGTVLFAEVNGTSNEYLDVIYGLSEGPIDAIGEMYLDDEVVPETMPADQVPGAANRVVLSLTGKIMREITILLRLVEPTDVGASSGAMTWADLQDWAAGTYDGVLSLARHWADSEDTSWQFDLTAAPFVYDGAAENLQISLTVPSSAGIGVTASVVTGPSAANGHTMLIRLSGVAVMIDEPLDFALTINATAHSPGVPQYLGVVRVNRHLGADDQVADVDLVESSTAWTAAHQLAGIAYCYVRYVFNPDRWPRGIPQASWLVRGRPVYDPRLDDTAWSDNPALAIRDQLVNARYGAGRDPSTVDDEAIAAAADYYDELVDDGAGGTEPRYTCNGVVDTGRPLKDRAESLLSCCRSWLVYAGGLYRLVPDAPAEPVMTFDESSIHGDWSIDLGANASMTNRIGAVFWDPANAWRSGSVAADNEVARSTEDAGLLLEREIQLEYTTSRSMAYRLAILALNASRLPMTVGFTAFPDGIRCLPGDIVAIDHQRPGWEQQLLRVTDMTPREDGLIEIAGRQYNEAAYDVGEILAGVTAPGTNLPTPLYVARPGQPVLSEALYATRDGGGVKVRIDIDLGVHPSAWVRGYYVDVIGPRVGAFPDLRSLPFVPAETPTTAVYDVAPGVWLVRSCAVNHMGIRSAWSDVATLEVTGLAAPPGPVTGLTAYALSGLAVLSWDSHPDLDVRIGGLIRVRIYTGTSTPTWDDGLEIGYVPGISEGDTFPLLAGWYMVKAVDSTGQESDSFASVQLEAAEHETWSLITTFAPAPTWSGSHDDTEVEADSLQLEVVDDEVAALTGTWTSSVTTDVGAIKVLRLRASITSQSFAISDLFDSRPGLIDSWPSWDGDAALVVGMRAFVLVRYSDDNSTWSTWRRFAAADVKARYLQWGVMLISGNHGHNIIVAELSVTVEELA
jgi:hypothetical protein